MFFMFIFIVCPAGFYGQDCLSHCNCTDTCLCDPVTGDCPANTSFQSQPYSNGMLFVVAQLAENVRCVSLIYHSDLIRNEFGACTTAPAYIIS